MSCSECLTKVSLFLLLLYLCVMDDTGPVEGAGGNATLYMVGVVRVLQVAVCMFGFHIHTDIAHSFFIMFFSASI